MYFHTMKAFTFDKSARADILTYLKKAVDGEGYIVEKENLTQRVLTQEGEEIHESKFGGIRKGSEIFIKSDLVSLINLYDYLAKG